MGLPSSATAWLATLENPWVHYPGAFSEPRDGWGPWDWTAQARVLVSWWMGDRNPETGARLRPRSPETNGCLGRYEVSESGTPHIHLFCCSRAAIKPKAFLARFADAEGRSHLHLERCEAEDVGQVEAYLAKDPGGPHAAKAATARGELVRAGEFFAVNRRGVSSGDALQEADEMLAEGARVDEIVARGVQFGRLEPAILAVSQARARLDAPGWRDVACYWRVGPTGTGKTASYLALLAELGEGSVCRVTDYEHPFDAYQGERALFLDEFRPGCLPRGLLLNVMDGYPLQLPARYRDRTAAWERVDVAGPLPPEAFFGEADERSGDSLAQLGRRLAAVLVHRRDPSRDPPWAVEQFTWDEYRALGGYRGVLRNLGP